ncbi:hypothetical protein [Staphylococcus arlettae]|uniref:hypothetical protein n=1 Tax=Staphylococcus arlettae TaxID=29378 RepID=UPI002F9368D9
MTLLNLHFAIVFWLSCIFLLSGILSLFLYKKKKAYQESLLGLTVMLIFIGIAGILVSVVLTIF